MRCIPSHPLGIRSWVRLSSLQSGAWLARVVRMVLLAFLRQRESWSPFERSLMVKKPSGNFLLSYLSESFGWTPLSQAHHRRGLSCRGDSWPCHHLHVLKSRRLASSPSDRHRSYWGYHSQYYTQKNQNQWTCHIPWRHLGRWDWQRRVTIHTLDSCLKLWTLLHHLIGTGQRLTGRVNSAKISMTWICIFGPF